MIRAAKMFGVLLILVGLFLLIPRPGTSHPAHHINTALYNRCPWLFKGYKASHTPRQIASAVAARMTLEEQARMVTFATRRNVIIGVPRLCIANQTQSFGSQTGVSGTSRVQTASLASSIAIASSFDSGLATQYGHILGVDARADATSYVATINTNLAFIPNWGRLSDSYGEDPLLSANTTQAVTRGIHSAGLLSEARHFGPYGVETYRHTLSINATMSDLLNVYLYPFYSAVSAKDPASRPDALMCAYGKVNGSPMCANTTLATRARSLGFDGFIRTDMGTLFSPITLLASTSDIVKPGDPAQVTTAVHKGQLTKSRLAAAVTNILTPFFAHGLATTQLKQSPLPSSTLTRQNAAGIDMITRGAVLLKNTGVLPLTHAPLLLVSTSSLSSTCTALADLLSKTRPASCLDAETQATNYDAKERNLIVAHVAHTKTSAVSLLRQSSESQTYVVTVVAENQLAGGVSSAGPQGSCTIPRGNELSSSCSYSFTVPAHTNASISSSWSSGTNPSINIDPLGPITAAVIKAAAGKQIVVLAKSSGAEGYDRSSLALDGIADPILDQPSIKNPIVLLFGSGPTTMPWLAKAPAVMEMWYAPGPPVKATKSIIASGPKNSDTTALATAVSSLLTGKANPSGRLPVTFPETMTSSPASVLWPPKNQTLDLTKVAGLGIGYRWYKATGTAPLFPFGFGLSYSQFTVSGQTYKITPTGVAFTCAVQNQSNTPGRDVVELYATEPNPTSASQALVGYSSIYVPAHKSRSVSIFVPYTTLSNTEIQFGQGQHTRQVTFTQAPDSLSSGASATLALPAS